MKITKSTIVRLILVLMVIINFILEKCGIDVIPTDEYTVLMFVETGIEIAIFIVAVWKNNSVTPNAIKADEYLRQLKESE